MLQPTLPYTYDPAGAADRPAAKSARAQHDSDEDDEESDEEEPASTAMTERSMSPTEAAARARLLRVSNAEAEGKLRGGWRP